MKLNNFEITNLIEFKSGGLFWDIHNFAYFDGLELLQTENTAVMHWSVPNIELNPWGCRENTFIGMELHFKNLLFLNIGPRDDGMPISEDSCVSAIMMTSPLTNSDPYLPQAQKGADDCRLVFEFQSGRRIEIESEIVELLPVSA